jgi:anti-sigma factor RsiW
MTDDCADIRFRLALFRRGELDEAEAEAVRAHLAHCLDCSAELDAERLLDQRLAETRLEGSMPSELRQTVHDVFARERAAGGVRWHHQLLGTLRRSAVAAAMGGAAMLLVLAAISVIIARPRQPDPLTVPLAEALAGHRRGVLRAELTASEKADVDRLVTEIQQRLGVPTIRALFSCSGIPMTASSPS